MKTREFVEDLMDEVFRNEIQALREQGQEEYARSSQNAFANFERVAGDLGLSREQVLWVYARKHMDGVVSWINGHRSQREDVRGRINDLIVYLFLLRAMVEDLEGEEPALEPEPYSPSVSQEWLRRMAQTPRGTFSAQSSATINLGGEDG